MDDKILMPSVGKLLLQKVSDKDELFWAETSSGIILPNENFTENIYRVIEVGVVGKPEGFQDPLYHIPVRKTDYVIVMHALVGFVFNRETYFVCDFSTVSAYITSKEVACEL